MSALLCDLRPEAVELAPACRALAVAGESLLLHWPSVANPPFVAVQDRAALLHAWDEQQIAVSNAARLPSWFESEDFDRALLVTTARSRSELEPAEEALVQLLFQRGCEAVELLDPAEAGDLEQSWFSGRRTRYLYPAATAR